MMTITDTNNHKPRLMVIIGSVREGRVGKAVGEWFADFARDHGAFDVVVADLKELDLPLMTEPNHPSLKLYTQPKTRHWSEMVDSSDAFVVVMPEYNYGATAPVINALDYLVKEWAYKPMGLVSYGGVSGGLRAQQHIKGVITTLNMMPLMENVTIQFVANRINDETNVFEPIDSHLSSGTAMLAALLQWENALRTMRVPVGAS